MKRNSLLAVVAALLLSACQTLQGEPAAALLVEPDDEVYAELTSAVSTLMDGTPVMLSNDAFTASSRLSVERRRHENIDGRVGTGRIQTPPEHFHLLLQGGDCMVERQATGEHLVLEHAQCQAETVEP